VNAKVVPIIFDPATYYGDREADVAMTYLFGGFGADFYNGYESEWPLPEVSFALRCFGDHISIYSLQMCPLPKIHAIQLFTDIVL
jgi:fructosamine-3-kinase